MKREPSKPRLGFDELVELGPLPLTSVLPLSRIKAWRAGGLLGELDILPLKNDAAGFATLFYCSGVFSWEAAVLAATELTEEPWWASRAEAELYGAELVLPRSRSEAIADRERADERARRIAWRAPEGDGWIKGSRDRTAPAPAKPKT